jgi:hypothetical protein
VAVVACLAAGAAIATAAPARGDGDPASDVLATQSLFLPQDAGVGAPRQGQLVALLEAARRSGVELRVAVIASPADLGSVGALWRRPLSYSRFLGQELSLVSRAPLLVVMPNGLAVYGPGGRAAAAQAAVAALAPPGSVARLGAVTLVAIQRYAAATGHPLVAPAAGIQEGATPTGNDVLAWIVFALGAAVIVAAWTLSLRARPVQATSRSEPGAGHRSPSV